MTHMLRTAALTVVVTGWMLQSAQAQGYRAAGPSRYRATPVRYQDSGATNSNANGQDDVGRAVVAGYPYMNAGMYPSPQPHVPYQMGMTAITNQAFAPHEMLYPHRYRAMYAPFYWKVKGGWKVLPHGVCSHDHWYLQGTEVRVNYKSHISWLSGFKPPVIR